MKRRDFLAGAVTVAAVAAMPAAVLAAPKPKVPTQNGMLYRGQREVGRWEIRDDGMFYFSWRVSDHDYASGNIGVDRSFHLLDAMRVSPYPYMRLTA